MKLIDFEPKDLWPVWNNAWEAEQRDVFRFVNNEKQAATIGEYFKRRGPVWTLLGEDGTPVACIGAIIDGPAAEGWVYFTPGVRPIKAEFEAAVDFCIDRVFEEHLVERIYTNVMKGYEHLMPWVERRGFRKIGEQNTDPPCVRYELCRSLQH